MPQCGRTEVEPVLSAQAEVTPTEHTFGWLMQNLRSARDCEALHQ